MKTLLTFAFALCSFSLFSQIDGELFKVVDEMPRFYSEACEVLGGESDSEKNTCADMAMLAVHLQADQVSTAEAREKGISGHVVVNYVIEKDGTSFQILN